MKAISHLLYANDLVLSCRVDEENRQAISRSLEKFFIWSGQQVNTNKSKILFSKNTRKGTKNKICRSLNFQELTSSTIYLGNQLIFGKSKSKEFSRLKDKIFDIIVSWQNRFLLKVGKATLVNSVVSVIPSYTMSTFKVS